MNTNPHPSAGSKADAQPTLTVYKASAGSGKTFTLATEYIKLLVRNPLSFKQILAVTFTNKATEEMKMRILSQLYGIWRGLDSSKSYAEKLEEKLGNEFSKAQIAQRAGEALHLLLHNYGFFRVETIDSFFQSVMRNLARELNLTANLRVELNDVQVEEQAVDQLIDSLTASDLLLQWLMKYIMDNISDDRSWNVIKQIKKFGRTIFSDFYKSNSRQLKEVMSSEGFFDNYQTELRQIRQKALQRMKDIGNEFFEKLADEGLDISDLSYGRTGVASFFLKLQNGIFDESVLTKRTTDCLGQPEKWATAGKENREHIVLLAETIFEPMLRTAVEERQRQWKLYKSADLTLCHLSQLRLLGSIEQKVRQLNEEQNRFLLNDTQQLLHQLIDGSDSPFVYEKIGSQLEHIMIDEFQDTSTVQWQNFKVLLQETMSHKGSENLIVGDVKQSIYRWRSGDWRLLAGIEKEFANAEETIRIEPLDINRRSAPAIIWFNNVFFTEAAKVAEIDAYDDVKQKVPADNLSEGNVSVKLLPANDYDQATLQEVCQEVEMLTGKGVATRDIAILVRSNSHIPVIANYLMEQLPQLKVVSDEAFRLDASPAVLTIVAALRHLAHPDDPITAATLNAHLAHIDADDSPITPHLLQLPLYELTEQLYTLLQLHRLGNQSAYLCAFYDQVAAFVQDNGSDIDAFLGEWDDSIGAKTIQSPEADGLRIISIHKSKGLEFNSVILPFCDWRLEQLNTLWCVPREAPFNKLPLASIDFSQRGMKGTIYDADYEEEHQQNTVDNMNLLYVAFTRATRRLSVIGRRKSGATRSALIEQVLPTVAKKLKGGTLTGLDDEKAPLVFEYAAAQLSPAKCDTTRPAPETKAEANPFLQKSTPVRVDIEPRPSSSCTFRQSNKSKEFISTQPDTIEPESDDYIQIGCVLHKVLSTIRSTDDVEAALSQLENDGVLYGEGELTRQRLTDMLRLRLASPKVAEWFAPNRWKLFNECTIVSINPESNRVEERRPDRVMTDGHETIVVDFKFGRERKEYHEQVRHYMQLLSQMGHTNVRGYLWFVYSNDVMEVSL